MKKKKVLITASVSDSLISFLKKNGYDVTIHKQILEDDFENTITQYQGLIFSSHLGLTTERINKAKKLKWVARIGSGVEHLNKNDLNKKNIPLFSTPDGNAQSVAEHCLGLLLSCTRNIQKSYQELREFKWLRQENCGCEISSLIVGIIGFGNTGSAFASLLSKLGVKVLVHDIVKKEMKYNNVFQTTIDEVLQKSSVVSIHLPLTMETQYYCDASFFRSLKNTPIFINSSRGKIVHQKALIQAIEEGLISYAALDVLENEDLKFFTQEEQGEFKKLLSIHKIILTPHIAGYSFEARDKMSDSLIKKLKSLDKNTF